MAADWGITLTGCGVHMFVPGQTRTRRAAACYTCREVQMQFFSSSVKYPAMGVAPYRWGAMAQSNSSSDSSLGEESLRRTSAGAEFQSLAVRGKRENL